MNTTGISWTDLTWNPVSGCDKVSPGCQNCYAEYLTVHRFHRSFEVKLRPERLGEVKKIPSGSKVFVNSMSDLFHEKVPFPFVRQVMEAIQSRPDVIFQVLTKRPERVEQYENWVSDHYMDGHHYSILFPSNLWLGVSIEMNMYMKRIAPLQYLKHNWQVIPGKIFISFEPLLREIRNVDLRGVDWIILGGECLGEDTKISTTRGPVPITDLRSTDLVYGYSGEVETDGHGYMLKQKLQPQLITSSIKHLVVSGQKELYRVVLNGRYIDVSKDHKFLKVVWDTVGFNKRTRNRYDTEWVRLADLKPNDLIIINNSLVPDGQPFKLPLILPETNEDFMRVVGLFLGDGWVRLRANGWGGLALAIPSLTEERYKYIPILKKLFGKVSIKDPRGIQMYIYKRDVAVLFDQLGLNHKWDKKRIPEWCWGLPRSQKLALIEGYLDSDGTIEENKWHRWSFDSPNKDLITDFYYLCLDVGLQPTAVHPRVRKPRGDWKSTNGKIYHYDKPTTTYYFRVCPTGGTRNKSFLYTLTPRPLVNSLKDTHFSIGMISSITPIGIKPTFDLELDDPNHNFIANGVVVHNSGTNHRPFNPDWARRLVRQARAQGVAIWMKQMGGFKPGTELEDLPEDLRIREFPA